LWNWFGEFGIPILGLGGYASHCYVNEIACRAADQNRPAVLIYAGDHDASGDDIYDDFVARTDCWAEARRIALTSTQIEQYDLPLLPGKDKDTRAARFRQRHGYSETVQVEMDALDPTVLRDLYQEAISEFWDAEAYAAVVEAEDDDRLKLGA
jgi:hypothetical protein